MIHYTTFIWRGYFENWYFKFVVLYWTVRLGIYQTCVAQQKAWPADSIEMVFLLFQLWWGYPWGDYIVILVWILIMCEGEKIRQSSTERYQPLKPVFNLRFFFFEGMTKNTAFQQCPDKHTVIEHIHRLHTQSYKSDLYKDFKCVSLFAA